MAKVTTSTLEKMRVENDPITMLTCTDASFAGMLDAAEIDMFLIGDSLGMVVQVRARHSASLWMIWCITLVA